VYLSRPGSAKAAPCHAADSGLITAASRRQLPETICVHDKSSRAPRLGEGPGVWEGRTYVEGGRVAPANAARPLLLPSAFNMRVVAAPLHEIAGSTGGFPSDSHGHRITRTFRGSFKT
jgi:hypothetical protein